MSPSMCSIVLYFVCAGMMMTVWCAELDADKREIAQYEAMFKQFRDEKSETDHYSVVYSALQVFRKCDVAYQAGESVAKFRSLSFVDQIDLVIKALVKIFLVPEGLVNLVKQGTITEADFHTNYNAMPGEFLKDDHFDPERINCRMMLHYFLVFLFSSNYSESDETRSSTLHCFFTGFYKEFMDKVYNSELEVVYGRGPPKPKTPTWKVPRWQTVATYFGGAAVLGGLIAAGMHFWRTEPYTQMMANMAKQYSSDHPFRHQVHWWHRFGRIESLDNCHNGHGYDQCGGNCGCICGLSIDVFHCFIRWRSSFEQLTVKSDHQQEKFHWIY